MIILAQTNRFFTPFLSLYSVLFILASTCSTGFYAQTRDCTIRENSRAQNILANTFNRIDSSEKTVAALLDVSDYFVQSLIEGTALGSLLVLLIIKANNQLVEKSVRAQLCLSMSIALGTIMTYFAWIKTKESLREFAFQDASGACVI